MNDPASLPAVSDPPTNPVRGWAAVSLAELNVAVLTQHGLTLHDDAVLHAPVADRHLAVARFLTAQTEVMRESGTRAYSPCIAVALVTLVPPELGDRFVWRVDALETAHHIRLWTPGNERSEEVSAPGDTVDPRVRAEPPVEDRYAELTFVGQGPRFSRGRADRVAVNDLVGVNVGDLVDVLLDDGRIARCALRAPVQQGHSLAFVKGIVGGYAVGRVRPMGGFANIKGYLYFSEGGGRHV